MSDPKNAPESTSKPEVGHELTRPTGSADWLWCDVVGADVEERTVTVQLRDGEKPTVTIGDAARIFIRRHKP